MQGREIECDVVVREDQKHGVYANAFRIVPSKGDSCSLEFLLYSSTEQCAKVVSKVSVPKTFLPVVLGGVQGMLGSANEL
jgi:hypothetical protein